MRLRALLLPLLAIAPWELPPNNKRLVLDVTFETSKDYDITSAYAVRGWNTTEGHMKITCPSQLAKHGGGYGMEVRVDRAFTKNFHAQFSLPHFMPRMPHSAYQLTFWARMAGADEVTPEVSFLDVDEGYDWVGGAQVLLSRQWQHIAMEPVYTQPKHKGHEIQIAFLIGAVAADFFFDDIQLLELDVPSPPPPSPPPPPNFLLWLDAEGGPKGAQIVSKAGAKGLMTGDLSSTNAAHEGKYGFELEVTDVYEEDYYGMLSLPAFLVTDHERMYTLTFWAKATGNPKPRPHVTFQDEDNDYAWIDGEFVQLSAFWHQYTVDLVVPYKLRGHNVVCNLMLGSYKGTYYFDEFEVTNKQFVSPPPSPPSPPPSPPPNVLLQFNLETYDKGSINSQAWPEGEMEVVVQSQSAAHNGRYGLFIQVAKAFEHDWHAQVSFKPFLPPDTSHGYILSFWARSAADGAGEGSTPKVVFHDADDNYTPLKTVAVPLTPDWNMYQVDLSIPSYRAGHSVVIAFWVGEFKGSYSIDDLEVSIVHPFKPPPPPPPHAHYASSPPPPGVVALLGFEGTDDGVTSQRTANNGSWTVSIPDSRAAHNGAQGLYVEVDKPWKVASLAQLLLPRYVPRAGKETLLHLSFYAKVEKMRSTDPKPTVTVAFLDLHKNYEQLGAEVVELTNDWQMHYVVIDLKTVHVGHSIRPYLYIGMHAGIYSFDDFEYKEIEIEDGMAWLQRAPERIKQTRMGAFEVTFLDREEWPIDYGTASIQLVRHAFPLGVTLRTKKMSSFTSQDYQWYLRTASKHFWAGTLQKQLQWYEYEPQPGNVGESQRAVEELLSWADSQRWSKLSASLFDGGHGGRDHWSNKLACKDLQNRMHERLLRDLRQFGGRITRYEVWKSALEWREWFERCGEELFFNAYRWAQQADATAELCSSEANVLNTLTLTNAEAYHNMVWGMKAHGAPVKAVGVQARFTGEVDASTVKHRLDVLHELRLPVYITEFSIAGLDPAKHAYELEKFLRIAFSHKAIAGVTLGELWDHANSHPGSGLYAENKQPKPAAMKMDELWRLEWHTDVQQRMGSEGSLRMDAFYGLYAYELRAGERVCTGEIELLPEEDEDPDAWHDPNAPRIPRTFIVQCGWEGHMHYPVWATPAIIALISVGCLMACYRKRTELVHKTRLRDDDDDY